MKDEEMQVMGETRNSFSKPSRTGNMKTLGWEKSWRDQELEGQCDQNTNSKNSSRWDWILETSASTNYLEGI